MSKIAAVLGFAALVALTPFVASAQTAAGASTMHHTTTHRPTRSYNSEMRHRSNKSKERARASAEHMHQMRKQ